MARVAVCDIGVCRVQDGDDGKTEEEERYAREPERMVRKGRRIWNGGKAEEEERYGHDWREAKHRNEAQLWRIVL